MFKVQFVNDFGKEMDNESCKFIGKLQAEGKGVVGKT